MSGLVVRNAEVRAGGRAIVSAAGFTAAAGTVTALLGPNGAGKSTLLGALIGLRKLEAGTAAFDGADLPGMRSAERAKLCAYVEQQASTPERLTVRDVVALGRVPFQSALQSAPSTEDEAIVDEAIAALNLRPFATRLYQTLSGGEQQRVQLARVLAQIPSERAIIAGDFNSTPWSFSRRRWDEAFGLIRRTRAVFTWPVPGSESIALPALVPFLPIDHVYAGSGWATVKVERGPRLGSDHYPVVVTLAPVAPP